jgi:hypothetical protein
MFIAAMLQTSRDVSQTFLGGSSMDTLSPYANNGKTPLHKLEITRKYRQTPKGVLTNIYQHMKSRNQEHGFPPLSFTKKELHDRFLKDNKFLYLFDVWIASQDKWLKPSVDRIDPRKPYTMDNIQILTYRENKEKGDREKELLWGKPVKQLTMNGDLIAVHPSLKDAVRATGLSQGNISGVLSGKRNHTGGFKWECAECEFVGYRYRSKKEQ